MRDSATLKSEWGPGPWQDEPDELDWVDKSTGLPCQARRNALGAWCGYVGLPPDHPAHKNYNHLEQSIFVHGGITYSEYHDDGLLWLGFDCAHHNDYVPAMMGAPFSASAHYRTLDYVKNECYLLAKVLVSAEFILLWVAEQADVKDSVDTADFAD